MAKFNAEVLVIHGNKAVKVLVDNIGDWTVEDRGTLFLYCKGGVTKIFASGQWAYAEITEVDRDTL